MAQGPDDGRYLSRREHVLTEYFHYQNISYLSCVILTQGMVSVLCLYSYIIFLSNLIFLTVGHLRSLALSLSHTHRRGISSQSQDSCCVHLLSQSFQVTTLENNQVSFHALTPLSNANWLLMNCLHVAVDRKGLNALWCLNIITYD